MRPIIDVAEVGDCAYDGRMKSLGMIIVCAGLSWAARAEGERVTVRPEITVKAADHVEAKPE
ncbi:MAG: hypothetical protein RBU24_02960 [Kiritimatiellia bacterium]|jgi:hypothetical protein|nr:hypothetical protein [Kiritimatiellia bacterium]